MDFTSTPPIIAVKQRSLHVSRQGNSHSSSTPRQPERLIACRDCRQAKVRCDRSHSKNVCSRCQKRSLDCKVETSYKRYNKKMIGDLVEQVRDLRAAVAGQSTTQTSNLLTDQVRFLSTTSPNCNTQPSFPLETYENDMTASRITDNPSNVTVPRYTRADFIAAAPRSVGQVHLMPEEIIHYFTVFFQRHHHFLEILDSSLTPDECYKLCPLLFWVIVGIASRHDAQAPIYQVLIPNVSTMLWAAISSPPLSRFTIQAILLLSIWPFPTLSSSSDSSFMLVNIAKTAAMQLGLHRPEIIQDFLRMKTRLDSEQIRKAVIIWAGCYIASQSVSSSIGQPSGMPADWVIDQACDVGNQYSVPDNLRCHLIISKFIARANFLMGENDRSPIGSGIEIESTIFITMLEKDFSDLERQIGNNLSEIQQILLYIASLHFRTYYFFIKRDSAARKQGLLRAYATAMTLISKFAIAESAWKFSHYAPDGWINILSMAGTLLMKIIHSDYSQYVDTQEGEKAFNVVVSMMKEASIQENDCPSRVSVALNQLWGVHHSVNARREHEPRLNIKSRLGVSILHDALWEWRNKFGRRADLHPITMEQRFAAGEQEGDQQSHQDIAEPRQQNTEVQDIDLDVVTQQGFTDFGDADWMWDTGFPSFLPIDLDCSTPTLPPWAE